MSFLRRAVPLEKRVPVARGLPQLAYLLQVFPAPRGANRLARPYGKSDHRRNARTGIKRHIAVDTQGLVRDYDVTDRAGALAMFDRRRDGLSQVQNRDLLKRTDLCHG